MQMYAKLGLEGENIHRRGILRINPFMKLTFDEKEACLGVYQHSLFHVYLIPHQSRNSNV